MSSLEQKLGMIEVPTLAPSTAEEHADNLQEQSYNANEVHDLARNDMDFLAALAMPTVVTFGFPPVFRAVWAWILQYLFTPRVFPRLALGLPRGFGKSTVMKLLILFIILYTRKRFILIIAETQQKACNIIADVIDMLNEPNIRKVFGDWDLGAETDRQDLKKFGFRGRNIIIAGMGVGGSLRGLNLKNARPDVMLFDDIQSREAADSEVESTKIEQWLYGTALKAKDPTGCVYLFVANMYPTKHSLLRKLKKNHTWTKFIAGGILADGTSLWEDLQPLSQLLDEFEADLASGHPEIFYSEVLNDENANMNTKIDLSKVPDKDYDGEIDAGSFIVIDPSNDKSNSDAVSIGAFKIIDGLPVCWELLDERLSPGDTVREAIKMAFRHGCSLIAVESNAYQYSLLYWFGQIMEQLGITGIQVIDIYSGGLSKNTRILNMFKQLIAAEVQLHPAVRTQVFYQISQFNPLKRDNVDGILDLLTYAPRVVAEHGSLIAFNTIIQQQNQAIAHEQRAESELSDW